MKFHLIVWVKAQIEWLKSFFMKQESLESPELSPSMTNFAKFVLVMAFARSFISISWNSKDIPDIPENWLYILLAIVASKLVEIYVKWKLGGKDVQK